MPKLHDGACRGHLKDSTMVHDEDAEISIRLATLIANNQHNRSMMHQLPSELPDTSINGHEDTAAQADAGSSAQGPQGVSPQNAMRGTFSTVMRIHSS